MEWHRGYADEEPRVTIEQENRIRKEDVCVGPRRSADC